jgi:hypothetical protein
VEIYTDGGCEPNPGPGGCGVVLVHPHKRPEASGGFRLTTNNRMEIFAVIRQKGRQKPKRAYHYDYYLWCPKCQATNEVQEAIRSFVRVLVTGASAPLAAIGRAQRRTERIQTAAPL